VAHTFVATLSVIVHCGAKPILVDIGQDYNLAVEGLEAAITPATKAIIPVHMNGRCCNMAAILAIAEKYRLHVIEDAAQAMGAHIFDRYAGTFGTIGAFSLHPMKNLHCYGDGGVITTNNKQLAETLRIFRNHGQNKDKTLVGFGFNSRLDNLQAAFLNVNLQYFDADIARRRQVAARYHLGLSGCLALQLPASPQTDGYFDVYSSYPIRCNNRDRLYEHLQARKIECFIHWKQALHLNPALNLQKVELPVTEQVAKEVLSLPIHPFLDNGQCDYVIAAIREFFAVSLVLN
jgi:dTDP-4-amino-4,6-dideoxygalactose transaminase